MIAFFRSLPTSALCAFMVLFLTGMSNCAQADTPDAQGSVITVPPTQKLKAADVLNLIQSSDGRPVMVVIYASWCEPCKENITGIIGLIHQRKLTFVRRLFISIDETPEAMEHYMQKNDYYKVFEPYIVDRDEQKALIPALAKLGSHYKGKIPYTAFFSSAGQLVEDIPYPVDMPYLLKIASKARQ